METPAPATPVANDAVDTSTPQSTPEAAPKADPFAEKLELLTKKERTLWRQRQEIETQRKEMQSKMSEYEKWKESQSKAKLNPLDYLEKGGLSYDEITQYMLNGGKPTEKNELEELRNEFKRLREEQTEEKNQQKMAQQQAESARAQQAIEGFKEEITEFIESNKATYELSSLRDATEDIFTTINDAFNISLQEWRKNGGQGPMPKPLDIKAAADIVEDFYEKEVLRLAETNKLKSRFAPQAQSQEGGKAPRMTLHNNMASTAASVVPAKNDHDRMRRAMEKLG